jgi:hypothetical protein
MDFKTRASKSLPQVSHIFLESGLQKQGEEGKGMNHELLNEIIRAAVMLSGLAMLAIIYIVALT